MRRVIVCFGCLAVAITAAARADLVVNGDFEAGNSDFTSDYTHSPGNVFDQATYDVVHDPHDAHAMAASYGDHTSGAGLMMAANGSDDANQVVWSQTVSVSPHYNYDFSMWVSSWYCRPAAPEAELAVYINGVQLGDAFSAPAVTAQWEQFSADWNAGTSTTAAIAIYDNETELLANDFALDDISLVHDPDPATIGLSAAVDDTVITGGTGSLGATVSNTGPPGAVNLDYTLGAAVTSGAATLGAVTPGTGALGPAASAANTASAGSNNVGDNTVTFTATDPAATNSPQTIDAILTVLDHANASFAHPTGVGAAAVTGGGNSLSIDFGTVTLGAGGGYVESFFDVVAQVETPGFTADLDLDLISATGDTGTLFRQSGPATFSGLTPGSAEPYVFGFDTTALGVFGATYTFQLSDEDLPGAGTETLTLYLSGEVSPAIPEPAALGLIGLASLARRRKRS